MQTFFDHLLYTEAEYLNKVSEELQKPDVQAAVKKIEEITDKEAQQKEYERFAKALIEGLKNISEKTLAATVEQAKRPTRPSTKGG